MNFNTYNKNFSLGANVHFNALGYGSYTLQGKVVDVETYEPLWGAHVYYFKNGVKIGAITDMNGEYQLQVTSDDIVTISYLGYDKYTVPASKIQEVEPMFPKLEVLKEVVLTEKKGSSNVFGWSIGVLTVIVLGASIINNE